MNFLISTLVLFLGGHTIAASPTYLIVPRANADVIVLNSEFSLEPAMVRVPRHTEAFVPVALGMVDSKDTEPAPKIERAAAHVLDYVDFGGHTGENGAFGWYADFPAHR